MSSRLKNVERICKVLRKKLDEKCAEWHKEHDKLQTDKNWIQHELDGASFDFEMQPKWVRRLLKDE